MADPSLTNFSAAQFAELPIAPSSDETQGASNLNRQSLETYLGESQRVVAAMGQGSRWEALEDEKFRLALRPLSIFGLSFEPTVDLKVWQDKDKVLRLRSLDYDMAGIDYINQKFTLQLFGRLRVTERDGDIYLKGVADLGASLIMPPPISYLPENAIISAGNGLLASVLKTIHQRLCENLVTDYQRWAEETLQGVA
ncbi:MAG: DUF1997 domain-containing protein [Cyanobacteria bacterium P01_F01_bin.153]